MDELLRQHIAASHAKCPTCGYSLEHLERAQCPECGADLTLRIAPDIPFSLAWAVALMTVSAGAGNGIMWWTGGITLWNLWDGDSNPWFAKLAMLVLLLLPLPMVLVLVARSWFCRLQTQYQWFLTGLSLFVVLGSFFLFRLAS